MAYQARTQTPEPGLYPNSASAQATPGYRYSTSADSYAGGRAPSSSAHSERDGLVSSAAAAGGGGGARRPVSSLMQQLNLDDSAQNSSSSSGGSRHSGGGGNIGRAAGAGAIGGAGAAAAASSAYQQHYANNNMSYHNAGSVPGTPGTPSFNIHDDKQGASYYGEGGNFSSSHLPYGQQQAYHNAPTPPSGYGVIGAPPEAGKAARRGGFGAFIRRKPVYLTLLALLVLVAAGVGLGVGLPHALNNKSASTGNNALGNANNNNGGQGGATTSGTSGSPSSNGAPVALDSSGNDPSKITPLPFWNFSDPRAKVVGVSLGGWLVLERWMYEDWFTQQVGMQPLDEWTFSQTLGSKAEAVLQQHWNTWVTEPDLDTLASVGVNHIRIPIGHWAFIPTANGEPYIKSNQTDYLTQMLGWMWKHGMRALIDMHGMPGSQNGDQSSGHVMTLGQWPSSTNQARSDQAIEAVLAFLANHPYKSVVSAIAPVNEPCGPGKGTSDCLANYQSFLQRNQPKIQQAGFPTFFHHGFATDKESFWQSYAQSLSPTWAVINDNPYPGYFPAVTDAGTIDNLVCGIVSNWAKFPIPAIMTEWSLASGIHSGSWNSGYWATQASGYAWNGGSFFWNIRMQNSSATGSNRQAAPNEVQYQYSMIDLIENGVIPKIQNGQASIDYLQALPNPACGPIQLTTWS